jgi:hypothetical protein
MNPMKMMQTQSLMTIKNDAALAAKKRVIELILKMLISKPTE